ncbi:MAG: hypothetical protein OEU32_18075, partial [Acidimicrobiia bacterium]|nr:hypothetical protein [Acidimicrobiia bacterium]
MATTLAIGTDKGLFRVTMTSRGWALGEPELLGWRVTALATTGAGTRLAATGSGWFGPAVQRLDGGKWQQASDIPRLPDHLDRKVEQLWRFHQAPEALYLGVADAGLFRSEDDGITWTPVDGLNDHESAPA